MSVALDREVIYQALHDRLKAKVADFVWTGRRYRSPDDGLSAEEQPALCVLATDQQSQQERGRPTVWALGAVLIVWVQVANDVDVSPDTQLNQLVTKVEQALMRDPLEPILDPSEPYHTTLGGLVSRAWISGTVDFYQGTVAGQGAVTIPVEMLALSK